MASGQDINVRYDEPVLLGLDHYFTKPWWRFFQAIKSQAFAAVDLVTGVVGRLQPSNFVQATTDSVVLGRGAGAGAGDFQQLSVDADSLPMTSTSIGGVIRRRTVTIDNGTVLTLPTAAVELVPTPGIGQRIVFIGCDVKVHLQGDYGTIDANGFTEFQLGTDGGLGAYIANDPAASVPLTALTNLLTGGPGDRRVWVPAWTMTSDVAEGWGSLAVVRFAFEENLALNFAIVNGASGNLTGGDAANAMTFTTYYTIN